MISGWLGSLGRLVPVYSTPGMSVQVDLPRSYGVTLGGRRFVRSAPRGHREWSLSADGGFANELAVVAGFADGDWGDGPFWWLSPWAVGVNVLTPGGSLLRHADLPPWNGTVGGPVQAVDGMWFPSSAVATSSGINAVARSRSHGYTAVPSGTPYTASLYVSAGQRVRVSEFDSTLSTTLRSVQSLAATGSGLSRVAVHSTAGAGTTALRVDVVGAGACAGAALSLTSRLAPWGRGDGCEEAIVESVTHDVTVVNRSGWAGQSFTVKEVGG